MVLAHVLQASTRGGRKSRCRPPRAGGDYAPSATDPSVLQKPLRGELDPEDLYNVFGYQRDLRKK